MKKLIVRAKYRSPSIATGRSRSIFCTTSVSPLSRLLYFFVLADHLRLFPSNSLLSLSLSLSLLYLSPHIGSNRTVSFDRLLLSFSNRQKYLSSNGRTNFFPSFFLLFLLFRDGERERERERGREGERKRGSRFPGASNFHEVTDLRTLPTIYKNGRVTGWNHWKRWKAARKEGKGEERTDRIRSNERTGSSRNRGSTDTEAIQFWPLPCTISLLSLHASLAPFTDRIRSIRQRWSLDDTRHPHEAKTSRCTDSSLPDAAHLPDRAFSTPFPLFFYKRRASNFSHSRFWIALIIQRFNKSSTSSPRFKCNSENRTLFFYKRRASNFSHSRFCDTWIALIIQRFNKSSTSSPRFKCNSETSNEKR